jgi:hypothetical protein
MTFALLQKRAEFAKTTAASEETCAKKSTESALKLQFASTMYASEISAIMLFMLEMVDTDVEDAELSDAAVSEDAAELQDAELVLADQSLLH